MLGIHAALVATALCGSGETVLLDFYADWCGPCKAMMPVVEQMAAKGYPVQKVNVDQRRDLAGRFHVTAIPCFVMVVHGREVAREVGPVPAQRLEQMCLLAQAAPQTEVPPLQVANVSEPPQQDPTVKPASYTESTGVSPRLPDERFMAASVRLRVLDAQGHSCGSGTIIDARNGEALILTCGHIFRDSKGQGPIEVDLFGPQATQKLSGTLIGYSEKRDLGLVSIRIPFAVTVMPVADENVQIRPGDPVVTVGCNNGGNPSIHATRITSLDKFLGPPNIQVADLPVEGRSGGGLFTLEGHVIGVCNAADPADREGLYAALASIHDELDRLGLSDLYRQPANAAGQSFPAIEPLPEMPVQMAGAETAATAAAPAVLPAVATAPDAASLRPEERAFLEQVQTRLAEGAEVVCVIRVPEQRSQVLMLNQPSPELLQALRGVATAPEQPHYTSLAVPAGAAPQAHSANRSDVTGWAHSATQRPTTVQR